MNFELEKKTLEKIPTIVISNELFDALPVTPLVFHNNNWH
jgi:SAM-dependent MidA family methyltransferase